MSDGTTQPGWRTRLSTLGFGAAAIGNLYAAVPEQSAIEAIGAALNAGIRYVDTAPYYGFGLSERRLGAALAQSDVADEVVLSTKVGRRLVRLNTGESRGSRHGFVDAEPFEPVFDYSYGGVMESFEQSLERLGRSRVDILLAHDLGRMTHGDLHPTYFRQFMEGGYRAMRELRDAGRVSAIGLGVNEWEICEEVLREADFDVFLLAGRYTLLDQTSLLSFLPLCEERRIPVIIGAPFNSGALITGTRAGGPVYFNYEVAPNWVIDRLRQLESLCAEFAVPLAAAALQFPLAHPQVVSVIPGMASSEQVNITVESLRSAIPPQFWQHLRAEGLLPSAAPLPSAALLPSAAPLPSATAIPPAGEFG
jgi:D-threo-aldose 1-dehydrogenase